MRNWFRGLKLNQKFTVTTLIFIFIPLFGMMCFGFRSIKKNAIDHGVNEAVTAIDLTCAEVNAKANACSMVVDTLQEYEPLEKYLLHLRRGEEISESYYQQFRNNSISIIDKMQEAMPDLYQIHIFAMADGFLEQQPILYQKEKMKNCAWYRSYQGGGQWFFDIQEKNIISGAKKEGSHLMTYVRELRDQSGGRLGVIEVSMRMADIFPEIYRSGDSSWACFVDENWNLYDCGKTAAACKWQSYRGRILFRAGIRDRKESQQSAVIDRKNVAIVLRKVDKLNGMFVTLTNLDDATGNMIKQQQRMLLEFAGFGLLLIVVVNLIVRGLLKEFYDVLCEMRQIDNGTTKIKVCYSAEEMREMSYGINGMLERIQKQNEESIKREAALKDTAILLHLTFIVKAQTSLSLDSCRALALTNNKDLLISHEKINAAHYQRKAAFTNYLPNFSATGAYMRNQKEFSLLNNDQKAALSGLGSNLAGPIGQAAAGIIATYPELAPLISSLSGSLPAALDQAGNSLVDALRTDTRNVYAGAITLTQPLYMGGKIRAYNKITKYAEELARQQHNGGMQEVIMSTDQAYWQVISLVNKKKLAEGYLKLLQQLDSDVEKMIAEGVATKADGLSVRVKVNEAEMTLTKVEDGLSLARMLLCQLCGLDLSSPITLADENMENIPLIPTDTHFDLSTAYENRPEIRSLELATQIYKQKVNVTRAEHLPSIALMGNYMVTNPSVFNSFENKFKGMWNVGVMVQLPIWHWGEGIYKTKAAKAEARIAQYQLQDAREKIELQVNQAAFKVNEAGKKLVAAGPKL